jgi:hypothetical protein
VDPTALDLLQSVCAAAVDDRGGLSPGCRSCAPFDEDGEQPDGRIEKNPPVFQALETYFEGSFSGPGEQQAVMLFGNCVAPPFSQGGALLVEKAAVGWHWNPLGFRAWIPPSSCQLLTGAGRDLLACTHGVTSASGGGWMLFTVRFDGKGTSKDETIFDVPTNDTGVCQEAPEGWVRWMRIEGTEVVDLNGDGDDDLRVSLHYASAEATPKLRARIAALCKASTQVLGGAKQIDFTAYMKPRKKQLELERDGDALRPTLSTKTWLDLVAADKL